MTQEYLELQAYVDRMEVYLVVIGVLFVVAVLAMAWLLFWVKEGDDE